MEEQPYAGVGYGHPIDDCRKDSRMDILKKILAPTDFSELSARGVRYACQFRHSGDPVLVVRAA